MKMSNRSFVRKTEQPSNHGFTRGAIVRVFLQNFMTYREVEFFPGPNLNLILGPNGTGKSTIISAICLGMSGKPSTLARASQIGDYVRHGSAKAIIGIELYNPGKENISVMREITKDNRSTWKLQGKTVTQTQVEEVVRTLHIQVDNLCQFLPQEQVQNFSRLKDKQLLVSTMKAVGKPELEEQFVELINLQDRLVNVSSGQERDESELHLLIKENERWERDVRNFKERELLAREVEALEKKKAWLIYEDEFTQYKAISKQVSELKQQYESVAIRFQPIEESIAEKENKISLSQQEMKQKRQRYCNEMLKVNAQILKADEQKEKMENLASDLNGKRQSEKRRTDEIRNMEQQIKGMENELSELSNKENENGLELQDINRQMQELTSKQTGILQKKDGAQDELKQLKLEKEECQSKIKNIEDIDKNRLEMLRRERPQVYEAVIWLRNNRGRFNKPIYEPLLLSLNAKRPEFAKYIENRISFNDMIAFFCEDKEDMNDLIQQLREEKKLAINVVHCPPSSSEPCSVEYQPRISISELRGYGFHSYLRELFTTPEPVTRYLCKMYMVHNIPVGNETSFESFGTIRDKYGSMLPMFYGGNKVITIRSSKYRKDLITQMEDVQPSRFLSQSVNSQLLEQLHASLNTLENRYSLARRAHDAIMQEEGQLNRSRETLLQRRNELQKLRGERNVLQTRLNRQRQQLQNLQANRIDLAAEEYRVKKECGVCIGKITQYLKKHTELIKGMIFWEREREALQIYIDLLGNSISSMKRQLAEEKEQIRQLKDSKDEAERRLNAARQATKTALEYARKLTGVRQLDELSEELKQKFTNLPVTVADVDDAIHNSKTRIQLMGRMDEQVISDYEARKKRIDELTQLISNINDRAHQIKQQIEELKNRFLPPLRDLIERINNNFGRYYTSMHCSGEVSLYTGEGEGQDDFKNYGIKIRVKYRSAEPLVDLSANHHSGGERAVATALYMLAMQELTQVPFRCVDEINQGMDPVNERRVFDLLVETACQERCAQYFLLTPKLLPGLNYSRNMKIHILENGEDVMNYQQWTREKHLNALRRINGC